MRAPKVLVVAGLDPAGLAGLFADAEAVRAAGARPLLCAASTTLQTSRTVHGHFPIPAEVLERQIRFLAVAPRVVRVARDVPLPELPATTPAAPADPEQLEQLAETWGLAGPCRRLVDALAQRG